MTESISSLNHDRNIIRPAFLADEWVLRFFGSCIRRILVGLTGSAYGSILVGPEGQDTNNVLYPSVDFVRHPEFQMRLFAFKNRDILLDRLNKLKPTLIHGFWPGDASLAEFLSAEMEIPSVCSIFEPVTEKSVKRIRHQDIFAPASEPIYQSLLAAGIPSEQLVVAPQGTFVDQETSCFSDPGELPSIVVCEELVNVHDYIPLLGAVRHLHADGLEFTLAIMGEGPAEQGLRERVRDMGLTSVVTVVPPLRPVRPVLQGMDIFIHIKDRKRCNLALMEAMSVGLVVGGCADMTMELIEHEKTGLLFDPQDEMAVYHGLKQLLTLQDRARVMAENARLNLRAKHSVSGMVEAYLTAYRKAIGLAG